MLYILPLITWTAFSQAAYSGSFVPLMNKTMEVTHGEEWGKDKKLSMSLFAMIPLGAGEVIGALIIGKIVDKYGPKVGIIYIMGLTVVAFGVLFAYTGVYEFGVLTFFMTFLWGL